MSDMAAWRAEREAADERLLSNGFSKAFVGDGGPLGVAQRFTSCRTCGATVAITPLVEGETHPLDLHKAWHAAVTP